jgi:cytoskeletal protein CcmA (bactofilin family)
VDEAAKSVNCRHCHKRVITEALTVKDYVAVRRFNTANRMHITKKGIVFASVRADDLEVDGVLEGDVVSFGGIHLGKRARVKGDLRALRLSVELGAALVGDVRIGPEQVPELDALRES